MFLKTNRLLFLEEYKSWIMVYASIVPGITWKWHSLRLTDSADICMPTRCPGFWVKYTWQHDHASTETNSMHHYYADPHSKIYICKEWSCIVCKRNYYIAFMYLFRIYRPYHLARQMVQISILFMCSNLLTWLPHITR